TDQWQVRHAVRGDRARLPESAGAWKREQDNHHLRQIVPTAARREQYSCTVDGDQRRRHERRAIDGQWSWSLPKVYRHVDFVNSLRQRASCNEKQSFFFDERIVFIFFYTMQTDTRRCRTRRRCRCALGPDASAG